jgi:hypothetical protein
VFAEWLNRAAELKGYTFEDDQDFADACTEFKGRRCNCCCLSFDYIADRYGIDGDRKDKPGMSQEEFDGLGTRTNEQLVAILVACGLSKTRLDSLDKQQLLDIIKVLRGAKKECFAKLFGNFMGRTGGSLDCICQHLIQFAMKFNARPESPRDPASLLAWFKHVPHCAFYDFWCGGCDALVEELAKVGVHIGKRKGAIVSESEYESKKRSLPISVPEFAPECPPSKSLAHTAKTDGAISINVDRPPHIITSAKSFAALHDDFHGASHKRCLARASTNIVELHSINTSRQEHLNRIRLLHDPFLRNQTLQRNMFLHLVIAHRRNVAINIDLLAKLEAQLIRAKLDMPDFNWKLTFNEITGRVDLLC